ncbi:Alpha/Beta hydrolase protein [Dipodascopsis uninucleata]
MKALVMETRFVTFMLTACLLLLVSASSSISYCDEQVCTAGKSLPIIDLGYAKYRATEYEKERDLYVFKQVRYAAPPIGNRRFKMPELPLVEEGVQTGHPRSICYQSYNTQFRFMDLFVSGKQSEDCLFLDVFVPGKILRSTQRSDTAESKSRKRYPVLTWIHGGGFSFGSKDGIYNPRGLLEVADNGFIYVALNYRLGVFGFLGGSEIERRNLTNVGLHDQRMALSWIQDHIDKFGGDPEQVTVMGESAGASSILHHITSPEKPLFKRAILQSPAYYPEYDRSVLDNQFWHIAEKAGCRLATASESLSCMEQVDIKVLDRANRITTLVSQYGLFNFGPYTGGSYVPELPNFRLRNGEYSRDIEILTSYNIDEGAIFTDPRVITEFQFNDLIDLNFPNASQHVINELKSLYSNADFASMFGRVSSIIADWIIDCNAVFVKNSFPDTYMYRFSIPPGIHSLDVFFTFWGAKPELYLESSSKQHMQEEGFIPLLESSGIAIGKLAPIFQSYLTSFAMHGNPNIHKTLEGSVTYFPNTDEWKGTPMLDVQPEGFSLISLQDDGPRPDRCKYWFEGSWTGITYKHAN